MILRAIHDIFRTCIVDVLYTVSDAGIPWYGTFRNFAYTDSLSDDTTVLLHVSMYYLYTLCSRFYISCINLIGLCVLGEERL